MMFLMNKRSLPQPLRKEGSPILSLEDKQGDYCKSSANRALPLSGELEGAGAWGGFFFKLKKMFSYSSSISRGVVDCTPELFYQVVRSEKVGKICAEIADAHELKMRGFPNGRRISADAVPSGLSIFDLDHISTLPIPQLRPSEKSEGGDDGGHDSLENVLKALKESGCIGKSFSNLPHLFSSSSPIALIHISPSCEGLRFVFRLPEGMSLSEGQKWFAGQLGINDYDVCVKDYARCSFAVPEDYILYVNEEKLFKSLPQPLRKEGMSSPTPPKGKKPPPTPPKGGECQFAHWRISKEMIANLQQIGHPLLRRGLGRLLSEAFPMPVLFKCGGSIQEVSPHKANGIYDCIRLP